MMKSRLIAAMLFVLFWVSALPASAQFVLQPREVQFDVVKAEHDLVYPENGALMVDRYELRIFLPGVTGTGRASAVTYSDLGKPAYAELTPADPNLGRIVVNRESVFVALPIGGYVARIAAINTAGEGVSDLSNPFGAIRPPTAPVSMVVRP